MTQNSIVPQHGIINTYDDTFFNKRFFSYSPFSLFFIIIFNTTLAIFTILFWINSHLVLCFICGLILLFRVLDFIGKYRQRRRINYILNTPFPPQLWQNELLRNQPLHLSQKKLIEAGLRDFFILHLCYPKKPLAMPSQLVDKLWHAFILDTTRYQNYCKKAFGKIFHHIPNYTFSDRGNNIKLFTWQIACRLQGIRPARPARMPRLFGIDPLLMTGMVAGSTMWLSYQQQMGMQYQRWHSQTFNSESLDGIDFINDYNDSCDVGLTIDGDCSCGGSGADSSGDGGSSCGGGCGGGGD